MGRGTGYEDFGDPPPYNLCMGNLGVPEILVIAVIGLLVFGPRRLPEMARNAGRALHEFKRVTGELTEELKAGLEEPPAVPLAQPQTGILSGTEMLPVDPAFDGHGNSESKPQSYGQDEKEPPPGKDV